MNWLEFFCNGSVCLSLEIWVQMHIPHTQVANDQVNGSLVMCKVFHEAMAQEYLPPLTLDCRFYYICL